MNDGDPAVVRERALRLLARREHTRSELARKLRQRGESDGMDGVLDALERDGLLSDARFAEAYVRMRVGRGYGPLRIQAELMERGVDPGQAETSLRAGESDWAGRCEAVARKHFSEPAPDVRERARRVRFLQRRGFASADVKTALAVIEQREHEQ